MAVEVLIHARLCNVADLVGALPVGLVLGKADPLHEEVETVSLDAVVEQVKDVIDVEVGGDLAGALLLPVLVDEVWTVVLELLLGDNGDLVNVSKLDVELDTRVVVVDGVSDDGLDDKLFVVVFLIDGSSFIIGCIITDVILGHV